jgi:hypothetical protein
MDWFIYTPKSSRDVEEIRGAVQTDYDDVQEQRAYGHG